MESYLHSLLRPLTREWSRRGEGSVVNGVSDDGELQGAGKLDNRTAPRPPCPPPVVAAAEISEAVTFSALKLLQNYTNSEKCTETVVLWP